MPLSPQRDAYSVILITRGFTVFGIKRSQPEDYKKHSEEAGRNSDVSAN